MWCFSFRLFFEILFKRGKKHLKAVFHSAHFHSTESLTFCFPHRIDTFLFFMRKSWNFIVFFQHRIAKIEKFIFLKSKKQIHKILPSWLFDQNSTACLSSTAKEFKQSNIEFWWNQTLSWKYSFTSIHILIKTKYSTFQVFEDLILEVLFGLEQHQSNEIIKEKASNCFNIRWKFPFQVFIQHKSMES